jgi:hypothetical protein
MEATAVLETVARKGVQVQVLSSVPIYQRVGEYGRLRLSWAQEIEGSNPSTLTIYYRVAHGGQADSKSVEECSIHSPGAKL